MAAALKDVPLHRFFPRGGHAWQTALLSAGTEKSIQESEAKTKPGTNKSEKEAAGCSKVQPVALWGSALKPGGEVSSRAAWRRLFSPSSRDMHRSSDLGRSSALEPALGGTAWFKRMGT
ncbi:unnamed protein product [Effrenium voratum]|uniref:Uncharacterized protein n=1 Tax=Effrenium voratum TaxID=2562239 RepID=A0AA36HKM7_9DINO|nr:unnamed protein product [Effrenium voratum]